MRSAASFIPVPVKEVRDAHALSIGSTHACAIVGAAHTLTCWGESSEDRLGSPTVEGQGPTVVRGLEGAIRELKEALQYREGYVPAHVALGVVQLGLGDLGAARRSWVRAVELEPDNKAAVMYVRMLDTQQRGQ